MPRFPIGFWNYSPIDVFDASCVADWADAGMTLTMSPEFGPSPDHTRRMREILDAAQARDIRVILGHEHTYWPNLMRVGEETYCRQFRKALKDFGDHPAVFGFHVGDEPDTANFAPACRAVRLLKDMAPRLSPFLNLLPWHPGCEPRVGFTEWNAYLDAYAEAARPDFLCYDCYSQMNPGTEGWDMYFKNLREFHEAAQRHGIPYWTTLLSVGHFRYRCPREDDFRWQLNTAIAHGAKGILYFFFYMRQPHENYRVSPVDEHWERTETYEWLSRVNRTFLNWHAPVVQELTLERVSHVGKAWGGVAEHDGSGMVERAVSHCQTPLVVSEFRHANGSRYVAVVNNSQTDSSPAELRVRGRKPRLHRVGWKACEEPAPSEDSWKYEGRDDGCLVRCWLAPGQMELYRFDEAGAP